MKNNQKKTNEEIQLQYFETKRKKRVSRKIKNLISDEWCRSVEFEHKFEIITRRVRLTFIFLTIITNISSLFTNNSISSPLRYVSIGFLGVWLLSTIIIYIFNKWKINETYWDHFPK